MATNIGKASAALAIGGVEYEQALGMLTAITEIQRSGAKAARGLVSIQSRYNQILDDTSSTGQKLIAFYDEHSIQLYDQEGQLRSLWETLSDVAKIWDILDENEQKYFLNIQAGANQSVQLGALMGNFQTAIEATETALNSAGSAMQENIAFMEGLESRTNLLSATFQNLANDVIPKELIDKGLNILNKSLTTLDNNFGVILTRITMLTGIGWGATSLLRASKIVPTIASQYRAFAAAITGVSNATVTFQSVAFPVIGILTTLGILTAEIIKHIKENNHYTEEATKLTKQYNEELQRTISNRDAEISKTQAVAKTVSTYVARLEQLDSKTNKTNQEQSEYHSILEKIVHVMPSVAGSINLQTNEIVGGTKALKEQIEAWKDLAIAQAYQDSLTDVYKKQADAQLKYQEQLTELNLLKTQQSQTKADIAQTEELLKALRNKEKYGVLTPQDALALKQIQEQYNSLTKSFGPLASDVIDANNALQILENNMNSTTEAARKAEEALSAVLGTSDTSGATASNIGNSEFFKTEYQAKLNNYLNSIKDTSEEVATSTGSSSASVKQTGFNLQTIISLSESYIDLLESEYSLLEAQGASEEELKLKANEIKDNMHLQAEFLREVIKNGKEYKLTDEDINEIQTKINNRSADWWTWNNKNKEVAKETAEIFEHVTDEYEKLIELSNEQLSEQKDAISALQSGMVDYYQEQINDIDKQIEALRNANEEINTQIELQEKLDSLAKAKQKKVLVYSNGSWNYVSDTDAVSTASKELDTYKRQRQLEENISALEDEKTILEQVQSSWENLTSDYEKLQNDWLINQRLGIDTTRENWQTLVADARTYATQYMGIMSALAQVSGLSVSGLDYDPTVDYSALMLSASSYEEALKWGAYRESKIVGEQLTPTKSSQDFLNEWKNKIAASRWNRMYSSNLPSYNSVAQKLSSGSGISSTGGNMQSLSLPRKEKLPYIQSLGNQMAVTIQALNLPNVTKGQEFAEYVKTHMFGQVMQLVH